MPYPDQWTDDQDSPEITVNNMAAAVAHVATYARRPKTTAGLVWGIYGGRWGGFVNADQTFTLDDDTTSYQVVEIATGEPSISDDDTNWLDTDNFARCYLITTAGGVVTAYEDHRGGPGGIGGGAGGGGGGGGGSNGVKVVATTGYTFLEADSGKLIYFNNLDGSNLLLPDSMPDKWWVDVQNQSSNSCVIEVTGGSPLGKINDDTTLALDIGQGSHIVSNGTDFFANNGMADYSPPSLPSKRLPVMFVIGDELTPLTTGTAKFRCRQLGDNFFDQIRASLNVAQASGAQLVTIDFKVNGVSALSTLLTFDNTETTTKTATTPVVIDNGVLTDDDLLQVDVTVQLGSVAAGLKVYLGQFAQDV